MKLQPLVARIIHKGQVLWTENDDNDPIEINVADIDLTYPFHVEVEYSLNGSVFSKIYNITGKQCQNDVIGVKLLGIDSVSYSQYQQSIAGILSLYRSEKLKSFLKRHYVYNASILKTTSFGTVPGQLLLSAISTRAPIIEAGSRRSLLNLLRIAAAIERVNIHSLQQSSSKAARVLTRACLLGPLSTPFVTEATGSDNWVDYRQFTDPCKMTGDCEDLAMRFITNWFSFLFVLMKAGNDDYSLVYETVAENFIPSLCIASIEDNQAHVCGLVWHQSSLNTLLSNRRQKTTRPPFLAECTAFIPVDCTELDGRLPVADQTDTVVTTDPGFMMKTRHWFSPKTASGQVGTYRKVYTLLIPPHLAHDWWGEYAFTESGNPGCDMQRLLTKTDQSSISLHSTADTSLVTANKLKMISDMVTKHVALQVPRVAIRSVEPVPIEDILAIQGAQQISIARDTTDDKEFDSRSMIKFSTPEGCHGYLGLVLPTMDRMETGGPVSEPTKKKEERRVWDLMSRYPLTPSIHFRSDRFLMLYDRKIGHFGISLVDIAAAKYVTLITGTIKPETETLNSAWRLFTRYIKAKGTPISRFQMPEGRLFKFKDKFLDQRFQGDQSSRFRAGLPPHSNVRMVPLDNKSAMLMSTKKISMGDEIVIEYANDRL